MAVTQATELADFSSGIGTEGAILEVDNNNNRIGIGTTNPQAMLQVGQIIKMDGPSGIITATTFDGDITGQVTGNATGLTGTPDITVGDIVAADITVGNIVAVGATFTGEVTYEDVTNVDSIGIVTARAGIDISGGSLTLTDSIIHRGDTNTKIRFPSVDTFTVETAGTQRLEVNSAGDLGLVGIATATGLVVVAGSGNYAGHAGVVTAVSFSGNLATSDLTGTITNSQLAGSIAADKLAGSIGDSLLSTISTADKVSISALDIDGGTDVGADLVDADEIIVDDGGGGTNRRSDLTRVKKYIYSAASGDATASDSGAITLANSGVSAATYGSATAIPAITVDAKGRITSATTNNVNTTTNLATSTATDAVTITSSTGDNATISEATGSAAGVMSVAHHDKLDGIEANATADQTAAEIRTLVESASDSNVFTDADHSKLNGIASGATNVTNNSQLTNGAGYVTSSGSVAGATVATNVTVADESSDTSCNVLFTTAATGDLPPKSGTNLTFNSSSGALTATSFSGNGASLSSLNGSNISSGTVAAARVATLNQNTTGTAGGLSGTPNISCGTGAFSGNVTLQANLDLQDNDKILVGTGDDLEIYHDGSNSYIDNSEGDFYIRGTGDDLILRAADDIYIQPQGSESGIDVIGNGAVKLYYDNSKKFETTSDGATAVGHLLPASNNTYDLGSASYRWRNLYTNDLNLSNEGSTNNVDGTWGDYTIQEGENDLFLLNNRNGKKFKFMLQEVS